QDRDLRPGQLAELADRVLQLLHRLVRRLGVEQSEGGGHGLVADLLLDRLPQLLHAAVVAGGVAVLLGVLGAALPGRFVRRGRWARLLRGRLLRGRLLRGRLLRSALLGGFLVRRRGFLAGGLPVLRLGRLRGRTAPVTQRPVQAHVLLRVGGRLR